MSKRIAVIIVTYNSSDIIKDCLRTIKDNNDIGEDLEIIIVDNNSSDFTRLEDAVKSTGVSCRIVSNTRNGGYGQGNNLGISLTDAPVIMVMNPDVSLYKPVFKSALSRFEDENLALLGMEQYEADLKSRHSYFPIRMNMSNLVVYKICKILGIFSPRLFCVHGACFFVRKSAFHEAGGFDEELFMYGEEIDLHHRLRAAGFSIRMEPALGYIHPFHSRKFDRNASETGLKSMSYLEKKYKWPRNRAIKDTISTLRAEQLKNLLKMKGKDPAISSRIAELRQRCRH